MLCCSEKVNSIILLSCKLHLQIYFFAVPSCFLRPMEAVKAADNARKKLCHMDGDHLTLLNVYNEYIRNSKLVTLFLFI